MKTLGFRGVIIREISKECSIFEHFNKHITISPISFTFLRLIMHWNIKEVNQYFHKMASFTQPNVHIHFNKTRLLSIKTSHWIGCKVTYVCLKYSKFAWKWWCSNQYIISLTISTPNGLVYTRDYCNKRRNLAKKKLKWVSLSFIKNKSKRLFPCNNKIKINNNYSKLKAHFNKKLLV